MLCRPFRMVGVHMVLDKPWRLLRFGHLPGGALSAVRVQCNCLGV